MRMKPLHRLLGRWAVYWITRHYHDRAALVGRSEPNGWWYAPTDLKQPSVVLGIPPIPVMEWSKRRLRRWLRLHPEP